MKCFVRSIMVAVLGMLIVPGSQLCYAQHASSCTPVFLDAAHLASLHAAFLAKAPASAPMLHTLVLEADSLLGMKPLSVMDKVQTPPSGSKHDFMSMGPYWWPDSSKPDGLPYIRRDGLRNPEYYTITDQEYFSLTIGAVEKLSVAYAITRDARYSAKAAALVRVWFLDDETKMEPNMNHAQYIPGINTGRGIGIIETHTIYKLLDALCLLEQSREWKKNDDTKMRRWLTGYYTWLTTHPYGLDESNEKNNHGTWYDVQVVSLSLFLGRLDAARQYLDSAKEKRIASQIEPDGKQPLELARTKSWGYSTMNLSAFFHLAMLGDRAGVDLWTYEGARGGSLRKALDYLLPFTEHPEKWEYQNLHPIEPRALVPLLRQARKKYDPIVYGDWLKKIHAEGSRAGSEELFQ